MRQSPERQRACPRDTSLADAPRAAAGGAPGAASPSAAAPPIASAAKGSVSVASGGRLLRGPGAGAVG